MLTENVERISKLLSIAAIPVAIAVGGWWIQDRLASQAVSRDYVQLAVTILKDPAEKQDQELRVWAVGLVNAYSPVKLSPRVAQGLEKGYLKFPGLLFGISNSVATSPDGRWLLMGTGNSAALWDLQARQLKVRLEGHAGRVVAVAFSPDGSVAATGSLDRTVRTWGIPTGKALNRLLGQSGDLLGLSFSPDGRTIYTVTGEEGAGWQPGATVVRAWELGSGRLLSQSRIDKSEEK